MTIAHRLQQLNERIRRACELAERDPSTVRLLAASKTVSADQIRDALDAGQALFGESRAQELRDKGRLLEEHRPAPEWHFIGHLQRNKIKYLVGRVSLIHTIDRVEVAQAISDRIARAPQPRPIEVLVEVNLGSEWSKSGVAPSDTLGLCQALQNIPHISLRGLMAVPPWSPDAEHSRPHFERLRELAQLGHSHGLELNELSMGMSHDFEHAIACGATIIRVGTAIFGPRS